MTLTPDQAWQSALGQLQFDMPKASFDTWVRDTNLVSYKDGLFTIGVRNAYVREWLESRLTSTVTRLLMGMMNREVEVTFVVDEPDVVEEDKDESEAEEETTDVQVVHRLQYDEIVVPERVVAIPGYFSRLIPEIGTRNAWLYVGWRQAAWGGKRQDNGAKTWRIPVREIVRFSGMSRRTFFRAVEDQGTWDALAGLVERCEEEPSWARGRDRRAHRLPNHYTVHMTLPLSRRDAAAVRDWLFARVKEGMSLLDALKQAVEIQDLVGEILPHLDSPGKEYSLPVPRTVMEITGNLFGSEEKPPKDIQDAAEELHRKIINAFGVILMTHYFLETVIPNAGLTPSQAWLVALLRDRCYVNRDTGEVRDEVLIRGGYGELADWMGMNRPKTIWEWFREESGAMGAFLAILPVQEKDEPNSLRLRIRLEEPIFAGANDTIRMAQVSLSDGADDTNKPGADGTHRMAQMAPLNGTDGTAAWREWHSLKHLNTSQNTSERITPTTSDRPAAVVPSSWNLRKILVQGRVHPKVRADLLARNSSVQAFVSWLLYACSPAGDGIQSPLAYALASLRDAPDQGSGGAYDHLAALPPRELVCLLRWSVKQAGQKYCFDREESGNDTWDKTMGFSERHGILLSILLGDGDSSPRWERKNTQTVMDGEVVQEETQVIHEYSR